MGLDLSTVSARDNDASPRKLQASRMNVEAHVGDARATVVNQADRPGWTRGPHTRGRWSTVVVEFSDITRSALTPDSNSALKIGPARFNPEFSLTTAYSRHRRWVRLSLSV